MATCQHLDRGEADDDDELEIVCEIEKVDEEVKAGDPLYVLMFYWLIVVGAGLLKSEEILEGASKLSISNDVEFEEQKFIALMNEAREMSKVECCHSKHPNGDLCREGSRSCLHLLLWQGTDRRRR
ncbi:hypothetical protein LWI28_011288 [Acer negundo]|uniref:Uncharacterized protein n=1 Tax=Acer negundo TaxID=4023 RepID=A0AAD5NIF1_ACENE|nr:hypothetical protein LWI28_011288 [Acer negundo]